MRRSRAFLLASAALASLALAVACGTSNGDAGTRGLEDPEPETTDNPTPNRPAFEAGFPEDDGGKPVTPTGDGGPSSCNDPADPGSNAGGARALPNTDDNDENFKPVSGVISTPVDVDLYKLSGADVSFAELDTGFPLTTPGVELCVFVHCANAGGAVTPVTGCNAGTKQIEPASKWEGCCATGPSDPTPAWDCSGTDDSSDFLLRVSPTPSTSACQAYSFSYRF
jgi:hypothetical protein